MIPEYPASDFVVEAASDSFQQTYCPAQSSLNPQYIKTLSQGKFPIYLISIPEQNQYYAMKVFQYKDSAISNYFMNEARFMMLSHRNVICIQNYNLRVEANLIDSPQPVNVSYLLMEYAPYGDFFDAIITKNIEFDEVLTRTYFHQLINGLEYLHSLGVAHLDIKPENLLIGDDFQLKICDFDLSYIAGDSHIKSLGTKDYRAPELQEKRCQNPVAADVFSAGIMLFFFMTCGELPRQEGESSEEYDLYDLLQTNPRKFWRYFCKTRGKDLSFFSKEFKDLFTKMISLDPNNRPSIQEIKKSKWYNGKTYTPEQLWFKMASHFVL